MSLTFSNAVRWANCAASVNPSAGTLPGAASDQTDAQREGEAAAWVAAGIISGDAASADEFLGEIAPNGWTVDAAMCSHAEAYAEIVGPGALIEKDLTLFGGKVRGRPDAALIIGTDRLRAVELKYGYKIVEPEGNEQLICAAIAMAEACGWQFETAALEVFQPRAHHPAGRHRVHPMTRAEVHAAKFKLEDAATNALMPEMHDAATPGQRQCDYCPRASSCHALAMVNYRDFDRVRSTVPGRRLEPAELARERLLLEEALELMTARHRAIRSEMDTRSRREHMPGWCHEARYGHRDWTVEAWQVELLTGIPCTKTVMLTPAEMETEGADPAVIRQLSVAKFIGHQLVKWTSPAKLMGPAPSIDPQPLPVPK